jgi:hypothetical protein
MDPRFARTTFFTSADRNPPVREDELVKYLDSQLDEDEGVTP